MMSIPETMPATMRRAKGSSRTIENLTARLKAVPPGELAELGRRAGMALSDLLRMKREPRNIQLSTLERLATGFGIPLSELLGDIEETPKPIHPALDQRLVSRLSRDAERILAAAKDLAETARRLDASLRSGEREKS